MSADPLGMSFTNSDAPGPADERSFMFKAHASNRAVFAMIMYALVMLVVIAVDLNHRLPGLLATVPPSQSDVDGKADDDTFDEGAWETELLIAIAWFGALGGLLHLLQSMSQFLGRRELERSWLIFYCVRPPVGAVLALIVYFVLRMGVLSPGQTTGPSSINVYGVLAFAALSGMFSRQAVDKLAEIFETIFKKTRDDIASSDAGSLFRNPARADVAARLPRTNASESGATFQSEERVNDPDNR